MRDCHKLSKLPLYAKGGTKLASADFAVLDSIGSCKDTPRFRSIAVGCIPTIADLPIEIVPSSRSGESILPPTPILSTLVALPYGPTSCEVPNVSDGTLFDLACAIEEPPCLSVGPCRAYPPHLRIKVICGLAGCKPISSPTPSTAYISCRSPTVPPYANNIASS